MTVWSPHSLRLLAEVGVALVISLLPLPVPAFVVLLVLATLSLGLRGASWREIASGDMGALFGLWIGLAIGAPLAVAFHYGVGPGQVSVLLVQGNPQALFAGLVVALATSVGSELVFRGYVICSMHKVWGEVGTRVGVGLGALLPVLALHPSSATAWVGVFALHVGFGLLYLAGRKSLALPGALHFCLLAQPLIYEFANW